MIVSRSRTAVVGTAAAALSLGALTGCGSTSSTSGSGSTGSATASGGVSLVQSGNLTVCTHLSYKPFEFTENGKTVGFDMDIMDAVAKKLGVNTKVVDIEWAPIVSGAVFASNKCDIAVGGATITDKRKEAVLFSDPYFEATQVLLVKKDSTIAKLEDLKGQALGVQTNTTGQEYGEKNKSVGGYTITVFDDMLSTFNAVKSGRVAAGINDNGVAYDYVKANPDTKVATEFKTGEQYGIMMKKGNTALATVTNDVLKAMKADGSYKTSYEKWFGTTPAS